MPEASWDPDRAVAAGPVVPWDGPAWRIHKQRYDPTNPGGARKVTGRYHVGADRAAAGTEWPALYLALAPETCLAELMRHITAEMLPALNGYRLTELHVTIGKVLDCRQPEQLSLTLDDLTDDDYRATHQLGAAAHRAGFEGLVVPSATGLGHNLVLFPLNLARDSQLVIVSQRDPRLRPSPSGSPGDPVT